MRPPASAGIRGRKPKRLLDERGGNRLRVNVQLIDVETDNHLRADRFDDRITDLFI